MSTIARRRYRIQSASGTVTLYHPDGHQIAQNRYAAGSERRRVLEKWADTFCNFHRCTYGITPDIDDDALRGIVLEPVVEAWEEGVEVLVAGVPALRGVRCDAPFV